MRYDAAIIGAGAEGLTAAAVLGRAGLRVVVIERGERAGGRCRVREFHPGYRASPFVDEVAVIPAPLFRALDLARHGAVFAPSSRSMTLWPGGGRHLIAWPAATALLHLASSRREAIAARVAADAAIAGDAPYFGKRPAEPWPAAEWALASLEGVLDAAAPDEALHVAALALSGRAADPSLAGSALHLLTAGAEGGRLAGGLETLARALAEAARQAGAEFAFGLEATDILRRDGRIHGVGLADGSGIEASAVISTLDLKRTFLGFFPWNALPKAVIARVSAFRLAGTGARVLFALDGVPSFATADGPVHVGRSWAELRAAHDAWSSGTLAERLPVTLRTISAAQPGFAPPGCAVVTATLGAVPFRLFDGAWTHEKCDLLRLRALAAIESVSADFAAKVVGCEVVAPPDIEDALGATEGDLLGGELASDQLLNAGPWTKPAMPRTPIENLYLAGSHVTAGAFATGAAGAAAAAALLADRGRTR